MAHPTRKNCETTSVKTANGEIVCNVGEEDAILELHGKPGAKKKAAKKKAAKKS